MIEWIALWIFGMVITTVSLTIEDRKKKKKTEYDEEFATVVFFICSLAWPLLFVFCVMGYFIRFIVTKANKRGHR